MTQPDRSRITRLSSHAFRIVATLGGAATGGFVFSGLDVPLAWMLGSMITVALASAAGLPVSYPGWFRPPVRMVVGCLLGAGITPAVISKAPGYVVPMLGMVVCAVLIGIAGWLILRVYGRLDPPTAMFGAMPGGLVELMMLNESYGGNNAALALIHTIRIFGVVMMMPFLAVAMTGQEDIANTVAALRSANGSGLEAIGWIALCGIPGALIARLLRMPSPDMFGALILSGVVHYSGVTDFSVPHTLLIVVQVVVGISIGIRFRDLTWSHAARVLKLSLLLTFAHAVITGGTALVVSGITGKELILLIVAYAPAGLTEMSLIALALGRDAVFVALHHLIRVLGVIVVCPPLYRRLYGNPPPGGPGG